MAIDAEAPADHLSHVHAIHLSSNIDRPKHSNYIIKEKC